MSEAEIAELMLILNRLSIPSDIYTPKKDWMLPLAEITKYAAVQTQITSDVEARIIALSCNEPPQGRSKWTTLLLLADKAVELKIIDSISYVAVGQFLKETNSNRI